MRRYPLSPLGTKPRGELQKGDTLECRETRCKSKSFYSCVKIVAGSLFADKRFLESISF
jgi:hypothetical protein